MPTKPMGVFVINLFRAFGLCVAFFAIASLLVAKQPPPPPPPPPIPDAVWMTYPTQNNLPPANKDFVPTAKHEIKSFPGIGRRVNVFIKKITVVNGVPVATQVWTDTVDFIPMNTIVISFKGCNLAPGLYELNLDWGNPLNIATWVFNTPEYFAIP